jgi:hypothetical protein
MQFLPISPLCPLVSSFPSAHLKYYRAFSRCIGLTIFCLFINFEQYLFLIVHCFLKRAARFTLRFSVKDSVCIPLQEGSEGFILY